MRGVTCWWWGCGSALVLLVGSAQAREGGLAGVTLNGDTASISGAIEIDGTPSGSFLYRIKKTEVQNGELVLVGPLTATTGGVSQSLPSVAMRLSDANGLCHSMAVTTPELLLKRLDVDVDSVAVDLTMLATTPSGQLLGNSLCAATHLLDTPGPLTSTVASLLALANRSLAYAGGVARPPSAAEPAAAPMPIAPAVAEPAMRPPFADPNLHPAPVEAPPRATVSYSPTGAPTPAWGPTAPRPTPRAQVRRAVRQLPSPPPDPTSEDASPSYEQ